MATRQTGRKKGDAKADEIAALQHKLERAKRLRDTHDEDVCILQKQLKEITQPKEPDTYSDPSPVIRFQAIFTGGWRCYTFAALGFHGRWYLTQSSKNIRAMSWSELLTFICESNWHTLEVLG